MPSADYPVHKDLQTRDLMTVTALEIMVYPVALRGVTVVTLLCQSAFNNVGVRMNLSFRRLPFKQPSSSRSRRAPICAASCQEMTNVLPPHTVGDSPVTSTASGKVFITRHGERADLADEHWLAQAEVGPGAQFALADRSVQQPGCVQVADDPPLTQQGIQQAHELGLRLQVLCRCL